MSGSPAGRWVVGVGNMECPAGDLGWMAVVGAPVSLEGAGVPSSRVRDYRESRYMRNDSTMIA
ncbi:hypothetical protein GCM10010390_65580 [Streptomyces mordarskii]|uniref:Uncharacterized protein n=1 Tax=Streptomyces mordarskii TaxID=1226758 RepID=A0ABN1DX01_9ACTN